MKQLLPIDPLATGARKRKTIAFWSCCLFFLVWRTFNHLLPCQLQNPPIVWVGNSLAGALYKYYGLYHGLVGSAVGSALFTGLLFASTVAALLRPLHRVPAYLGAASWTLYAILSSAHLGHNAHLLAVPVVFSLVFLPRKNAAFHLLWEGMRYYVCFVYASSLYWKLLKGAAFQSDFGLFSFRANLADYLLLNPETLRAHCYYFFLQHPLLLNAGAKLVFLMQGAFAIGFFTRKYDRFLLLFSLLIPVTTFLFADTLFLESSCAALVFFGEKYWRKGYGAEFDEG